MTSDDHTKLLEEEGRVLTPVVSAGARQWNIKPLVVLLFLIASACSVLPGGSGAATVPFGSGESFSILAALHEIPLENAFTERGGTIEVTIVDFAMASEAKGTPPPRGSGDMEQILDWLGPMTGMGRSSVFAPVPYALTPYRQNPDTFRDLVGFNITHVDAAVEVSNAPYSVLVATGELEIKGTEEVADGVIGIGVGHDFEQHMDGTNKPLVLGVPLRFASIDSRVLMSTSTDDALAWLDPDSERLDSVDDLAAAAEALDQHELFGAVLYVRDFSRIDEVNDLAAFLSGDEQQFDHLPIRTPFSTIGLGWGASEDEAVIIIVYVTQDEAAAEAAVEQVEKAFSYPLYGSEILLSELYVVHDVSAEGRVVTATLGLPAGGGLPSMVRHRLVDGEVLFVWGF